MGFDTLGHFLATCLVGAVFFGCILWLMRERKTTLPRKTKFSPPKKRTGPLFETRIVKQGPLFFVEKKYAGPPSAVALLMGYLPRTWERCPVPAYTLEQARQLRCLENESIDTAFGDVRFVE